MLAYIARRLFFLSLTLLGLSVVTFFISRVVPSDPARLAAGPYATEDMVQKIRQEFGLDKPLVYEPAARCPRTWGVSTQPPWNWSCFPLWFSARSPG